MTANFGPASRKRREAYQRRLHLARERRKDELAEHVADGMSVAAASRVMGIAQQTGSAMWREIVEQYGEQAK